MLAINLARAGFTTVAAYKGREALQLAARHPPLLTILDVMLPDLDGWDVCRRLRSFSPAPILMLSGLGEARDKIKGLTLGADDYMAKPCSFQELVARVKALLRRANTQRTSEILSHGALTLDTGKHRLTRGDRSVALTSSEFRLLHVLMAAPGRALSRDELLACLYPRGGVVVDRVIDVHIANLRHKIEEDPSRPRYILTVRGIGYRFSERAA